MFKVKCTLPNASTNINGIDFAEVDGGVEAVVDDASMFEGIPGYEISRSEGVKTAKPRAKVDIKDEGGEQ